MCDFFPGSRVSKPVTPPRQLRRYRMSRGSRFGQKSIETESEKCETSRGVILCDLMQEQKTDLEYGCYFEKPFTKRAITSGVIWLLGQMRWEMTFGIA